MLVLIIIKYINTELTKLTNKQLSIFMSFLIKKKKQKAPVSLHEFWCNLHIYEPPEVSVLIPKPVELGRYTSPGLYIHLHKQSPRTYRFQNPPRKPKLKFKKCSHPFKNSNKKISFPTHHPLTLWRQNPC